MLRLASLLSVPWLCFRRYNLSMHDESNTTPSNNKQQQASVRLASSREWKQGNEGKGITTKETTPMTMKVMKVVMRKTLRKRPRAKHNLHNNCCKEISANESPALAQLKHQLQSEASIRWDFVTRPAYLSPDEHDRPEEAAELYLQSLGSRHCECKNPKCISNSSGACSSSIRELVLFVLVFIVCRPLTNFISLMIGGIHSGQK